eukprot:TRINITY_DN39825_c0_g1_i1.p1 TRINITY_DN39825_c0_g1~~TRINITY_DN39825_c0_g1_i1.p1  ORF type:complete len:831 (+),score=127.29 TRINITY_DN39825_c0_g1_i1:225-2717(+)
MAASNARLAIAVLVLTIGGLADSHDSFSRERWWKGQRGGPQPGSYVELPGGSWTEHAQDVFFDGMRLCARLRQDGDAWAKSCTNVYGTETFRVVDGKFELDVPAQELVTKYSSVGFATDRVPGSWVFTARNYQLSGTTLFAELMRDDGTWVKAQTNVLPWHFLENRNGAFYVAKAPCASMGHCVYSYLMRDNATDLYCEKAVCDRLGDRDTCCRQVQSCAFMYSCGWGLVPDLEGFCRGLVCNQTTDQDICCVQASFCDSLNCVHGYLSKPNPELIQCPNSICFEDSDRDLCCDPRAKCWTLGLGDSDCAKGEYMNGATLCAGKECDLAVDLGTCCQDAQSCSVGYNCTHGYLAKPDSEHIYCPGPVCDEDLHLWTCCDAAAPCSDINCGWGWYQIPDTYCSGTSCNVTLDFDSCCIQSAKCSTFTDKSCNYGHWFKDDEWCAADPCVETWSGDRTFCCKPSDPCTSLPCPHGFVAKANLDAFTCTGEFCIMEIDRDRCCDVAAHCDTLPCPHGYTPDSTKNDTYCPATSCELSRDRDLCCTPAPSCAIHYTCPHGFTSTPDTYCDGEYCVFERDRDICCRPAMPCDVLECPLNFVLRYDTYCNGVTCIESRDLYWCCERGMALAHYKFEPLSLRQLDNTVVQMTEFVLFNQAVEIDREPPTVAYCIVCDTPSNGKEDPDNLMDNNFATKWLDFSMKPVYIDLPFPQPAFTYRWSTGNDEPARDPLTWRLWGSPDKKEWVVLHEVSERDHDDVPMEREAWTTMFKIGVPCYAPSTSFVPNSPNITCEEGDIIRHGFNCTPLCNPGYVPDLDVITCSKGTLSSSEYICNPE